MQFFEKTGIHYRQEGEYALPNLEAPKSPKVGIWGECRRKYMREHQKALYTAMTLGGTLNTHLEEVDRAATEMYDRLILQMAGQEGITEQLKAASQMEWVRQMNNIRNRVAEVVWKELICV